MCDLETSRMGAPCIYDISRLRVNEHLGVFSMRRGRTRFGLYSRGLREGYGAACCGRSTSANSHFICVALVARYVTGRL